MSENNKKEKKAEKSLKEQTAEDVREQTADGRIVLCGSNAYEKKYYLNPAFSTLPESIKNELQIICVLFTEEAGGVFLIVFEPDGSVSMETEAAEEDILYDDITAGLLVSEVRRHRQDLFGQLQLFYRIFILKEDITAEDLEEDTE